MARQRLTTPDGDFLDLLVSPRTEETSWPLVLVLHGLEGSASRGYMRTLYQALVRHRLAPVGLSFRGCSGEPNTLPRAYHSGETADPAFVLMELRRRYPTRPIGIAGVSLGGNVTLKLLGEMGPNLTSGRSLTEAAAVMSVPFDLGASVRHLEQGGIYRAYQHYFLSSLRLKVQTKAHLWPEHLDLDKALSASTLRAFDEHATAPLHGFKGADDYYAKCSSAAFVPHIRTPTVVVQALDDPFLPSSTVPQEALHDNPAIHTCLTQRGGHVGFIGRGREDTRFWAEEQIATFLAEHLYAFASQTSLINVKDLIDHTPIDSTPFKP